MWAAEQLAAGCFLSAGGEEKSKSGEAKTHFGEAPTRQAS